ncbi:hypothetical protein BCR24_15540 [Enterococcus ureilyticus]|uniref:Uncharacterized protein n=1 Tax=Enterococcus ureilyticus TaxID=1131292 RepID=A0A1E5HBV4_9ENTE|nr:hypothetical protein [Enterococcus ureilyticus]MBM7690199.1 hypothetical protein [Enterococcus ureilyticus]OEG22431.1 hypothetical protein BCR24_15540 [Enterococcus ureilyticus]
MEVWIPVFTSLISGVLAYFAATSKSKSEIKTSEIQAENEIMKIKEEARIENERLAERYNQDLEKMQRETDEKIRLMVAENDLKKGEKSSDITNEITKKAMENPGEFLSNMKDLGGLIDGLAGLEQTLNKYKK